jgi:2'-5' RNA ligase
MPRLFVAVPMPEDVVADLERLAIGLPGIRWADPDQFHLTLRFIGEVEPPLFYEIGEALAGVAHPPFDLVLQGLGTFPPRGEPHTLWAGVAESEPLQALRRRIERALRAAGVGPEKRQWQPHVTLGRIREPLPEARFGSWLARRSLFRTAPFPVSSFDLVSSVLRADGPEHAVEASYDFVTGVMERV